jgi:hypothetical protein
LKQLAPVLSVFLALVLASPAGATETETKGMVGIGLGVAQQTGSSVPMGFSGTQAVTITGTGAYFASSWVVIAADVSIGLTSKHQYKADDGDTFTNESSSWYIDGLVGVNKAFASDGFLYLAVGITLAAGESRFESVDAADGSVDRTDLDIPMSAGLAVGAGAGLPISDKMLGFVNLRHRFVTSEAEVTQVGSPDIDKLDYSLGGTEMSVGIGVKF